VLKIKARARKFEFIIHSPSTLSKHDVARDGVPQLIAYTGRVHGKGVGQFAFLGR
jgi:hypothetical protein